MRILYLCTIFFVINCQNDNSIQQTRKNKQNSDKITLLTSHYGAGAKLIQKNILIPANIINKNNLVVNDNKVHVKFHEQINTITDASNQKNQRNQQLKIDSNANINIPQFTSQSNKTKPQFYCGNIYRKNNQIPPMNFNNTERLQLVSTIYGFDMYVDKFDSSVSVHIKVSGTWQPKYINLIGHIVNPGDNVLNLGSQSGLQALVMGKIIGPSGKMFIFQPYSVSNKMVTKNIQLNKLQNITTIYKIGASDTIGTSAILVSYQNTGGSQIHQQLKKQLKNPNNKIQGRQVEQVQLDLVDNLLPKDVKLNFALIDVQKMEVKALKGMKQTIKRSPNLLIMCEWQYSNNPQKNKQETLELLKYFLDLGYGIYSYRGGQMQKCMIGKFTKFQNIQQLFILPPYGDIFFIPKNHPILNQS